MPETKAVAGTVVLVPVKLLEQFPEGARMKSYVQARGAHAPFVTFPSYEVTGEGEKAGARVTFLDRTETELVVGNPADGQTYRLDPALEAKPV